MAEIEQGVAAADGLILLWTPAAAESKWVEDEVKWALAAERLRPQYRILVLLCGGGKRNAERLLGEERLFIEVSADVRDAIPEVLMALALQAAAPPTPTAQRLVPASVRSWVGLMRVGLAPPSGARPGPQTSAPTY